jgi:hypothetical protein
MDSVLQIEINKKKYLDHNSNRKQILWAKNLKAQLIRLEAQINSHMINHLNGK